MIISATYNGITAGYTDSVELPDGGINIASPKIISTAKTLSGAAALDVFAANVAGIQRDVNITISQDTLTRLVALIESTSVDVWLLRVHGRRYQVVPTITSKIRNRNNRNKWDIILQISFVSEEV